LMNQPLTRFSQEWWSAYQTTWNEQENLGKKFAKLGKVILWFIDRQGVSVCSMWFDRQTTILEKNELTVDS
ncbi:MAG: hypothetical protein ACKO90_01765, partial [Microcystis panniformis]